MKMSEVIKVLKLSLWDPMDCSLPGSSVHRILQARILERVAIPFSRESSDPGIKPGSPALQEDSSPSEPPGKPNTSEYICKQKQIRRCSDIENSLVVTKGEREEECDN